MQHKAVYLLFCKFSLHVSGVNHAHHQEPPVRGQASLITLVGGSCTVPEAVVTVLCSLMMGVVDTRNL